MIIITQDNRKYDLSYTTLREEYILITSLSDEQFLLELPRALHLACIISWFKELPRDCTLGDDGIIHELVHLLHSGTTTPLTQIREDYARLLLLS